MDKKKYWGEHIQEQQKSGLSINGYCRKEDLSVSTFDYWKRKFENENKPEGKFVSLTPCGVAGRISIELKNGAIIRVEDADSLTAVLRVLNVS